MKLCYSVLVYVGLSVIRLICTAWYISFLLQMLSSSKMKNFKLVFRNLPLCYSYSYIYSLFDRLMLYRPVVRMMQKNCSHSTFQRLYLSSPAVCLYPLVFAAVRMCVCVCYIATVVSPAGCFLSPVYRLPQPVHVAMQARI